MVSTPPEHSIAPESLRIEKAVEIATGADLAARKLPMRPSQPKKKAARTTPVLWAAVVVLMVPPLLSAQEPPPAEPMSPTPVTRPSKTAWELIVYGERAVTAQKETYDVVVYGSEPEGIAAAVAAAETGAKTLLLTEDPYPGGLFTVEKLNFLDVSKVHDRKAIDGFFQRFYKAMGRHCPTFHTARATNYFAKLLNETPNLTYREETPVYGVRVDSSLSETGPLLRLRSMFIRKGEAIVELTAKRFVDASRLGDLARASGAPFFVGMEDMGRPLRMGDSLIFKVEGVDYERLRRFVLSRGVGKVDHCGAWGFWEVTRHYKPSDPKRFFLRGLNIAWEEDVSRGWVNGLIVLGMDPYQRFSVKEGRRDAEKEAEGVLAFLRQKIGGFENAKISAFAPRFYLREATHIEAIYNLRLSDILLHRDFEDGIAVGGYPVDRQMSGAQLDRGIVYGNPGGYEVPLRSLVPRGIHNLLVVGRAAGYSSLAYGSVRTAPVGMATGEAAGVAAALAAKQEFSFARLTEEKRFVKALQQKLRVRGQVTQLPPHALNTSPALLSQIPPGRPRDAILWAIDYGLIAGGYENQFALKDPVAGKTLANLYCLAYETAYRNSCDQKRMYEIADLQAVSWEDLERLLPVRSPPEYAHTSGEKEALTLADAISWLYVFFDGF